MSIEPTVLSCNFEELDPAMTDGDSVEVFVILSDRPDRRYRLGHFNEEARVLRTDMFVGLTLKQAAKLVLYGD
jgi:hypothetical protein